MKGLERFCDLLFELSNEDRLRILDELGRAQLHATGLSNRLDVAPQETSRHLTRLGEVGLIAKAPDGLYSLTPYGELCLRLVGGQLFASNNKEYFATHTVRLLPDPFTARLGEVSAATLIDDVMVVIHSVERVIRESREYIVRITDRYQLTAIPYIVDALGRGVTMRTIEPRDIVRPPGYEPDPALSRAEHEGRFSDRAIDAVPVFMTASESEVAALCFPLPDGRFDYRGFTSKDPAVHRWCLDLFEHSWARGGRIKD